MKYFKVFCLKLRIDFGLILWLFSTQQIISALKYSNYPDNQATIKSQNFKPLHDHHLISPKNAVQVPENLMGGTYWKLDRTIQQERSHPMNPGRLKQLGKMSIAMRNMEEHKKEVDSTLDDLLEVIGPQLFLIPFVAKVLPFAVPALPLTYILTRYAPATLPEITERFTEFVNRIREIIMEQQEMQMNGR